MSTNILENVEGVYLNEFYGGKGRGTCHQITMQESGTWVVLTARQMDLIVAAYLAHRFKPAKIFHRGGHNSMKHSTLELRNFVGDHIEVFYNGNRAYVGKDLSDTFLEICRFFDLDPTVAAEICTTIKPQYDKAVATYGPTNPEKKT